MLRAQSNETGSTSSTLSQNAGKRSGPGKRYIGWDLQDPASLQLDEVKSIRDDIARRVNELVLKLDQRGPLSRPRCGGRTRRSQLSPGCG
jgi:DNA-binding TFAR19-related protein (PDSD5 family)